MDLESVCLVGLCTLNHMPVQKEEQKFSKDFLNTFESSNDDSNDVNAPQEPIIFNQDPGENSSQSPPQIDHQCCYGCGDSLDGIFCQRCTELGFVNNPNIYHYRLVPKEPKTLRTIVSSSFSFIGDQRLSYHGDEHLDTILEKESDEFIKSSVENLISNPSESEDKRECDVPAYDDFTTFSNLLFDVDDDFSSSDNKIDSLLDEFTGELILLKSIPPRIDEADCDPEEEICLIEKLFNSLRDEIDLSLTPDDSMPPGIDDDEYDTERDMLILEELLSNDSLSHPKNESFILIFHHPLALLRNHRMMMILSPIQKF
nr:hypothetical protein [Tanacetum cinerariifolium]